ncbi:NACHT and WD repeat domain-containing protein [Rhodococcus spongiicola]|uniref:WD40 repeat domain-containing protein n=1 Tax=Rhodococcus spongiicola TaxID=2487352 RepID=A0A438B5T0_9NOCA|nr:AAA family ATPase [Rhodococcus spongiicola]RVW06310.1 WD40 repeat domain-containing protein [Rhodococcus spongiicola]
MASEKKLESGTNPAVSPARLFFADQLRLLFATAGGPPLKKVVSEAAALTRSMGGDKPASVQRLSDWRSGKRVPATFESVRPVLTVLIRTADSLHDGPPPTDGLFSLRKWEAWWRNANAVTSARSVGDSAEPTVQELPAGARPYRGLAPYREMDERLFFGRRPSVRRLVSTVLAAHGQGMVVVTGASGVGKSSLVQAGLIPELRGRSGGSEHETPFAPVVFAPGAHPLAVLVAAIPEIGDCVAAPDHEQVGQALRRAAERVGAKQLLLVVDQIEELFTQCDDAEERARFLTVLDHAAIELPGQEPSETASVVATMRSDFYAQALSYPVLASALEQRSKTVSPLRHEDVVEVITQPAQMIGLKLEAGLVDLILNDLGVLAAGEGSSTVLPLVSHLLDTMWERRHGGQLTIADYRATGGVRGSIASAAERAWEQLGHQERALARSITVRLVYVTNTGTDVKNRRTLEQLVASEGDDAGVARRVIDHFVNARVLVVDGDKVELIHDAVIVTWPRLANWIQEDRSYSALRQQVETDALHWENAKRSNSLLYHRGRLDLLSEHAARRSDTIAPPETLLREVAAPLTPAASDFLDASVRQVRRQVRLERTVMAALTFSTIIAVVMGVAALGAKSRAENERSTAQFQQVVALADALRESDPTTSAQLSLEAWQMRPGSNDAFSRLVATENTPISRALAGHTGPIYGVAISPDGHLLATASDDRTVRLWDFADPSDPVQVGPELGGSDQYMASVSFSPDGRLLAAGSGDGKVWIWDITSPSEPRALVDGVRAAPGAVHNVRFSPEGRLLAVPHDDGSVTLFDTSAPAIGELPTWTLRGHSGAVRTVSFRGETILATSSDDRTIRLWDITDPARPVQIGRELSGFDDVVHSVAFSPDGRSLAASSDDGLIRIFDTTDLAKVRLIGAPVSAHTGGIWTIAFAPDGTTLASASWDGTAKLWSVDRATRALREMKPGLTGNGGGVPALAFSPDGSTIVTGGQDSLVRIWTLAPGTVPVSGAAMTLPSMNRDGSLLVTAGYDPAVRLWSVDKRGQVEPTGTIRVPRPFGGANVAVLSPNGRILATTQTSGGHVQLWDVHDPGRPVRFGPPIATDTRFTFEMAFSPDGRTLAIGDDDFSVALWNIEDPRAPVKIGSSLTGPGNLVRTAQFSPDGDLLVAASADDNDIHVWDVTDLSSPTPRPLRGAGHEGGVNALAFSPDGSTLVTASDDHTLLLWDRGEDGGFTQRAEPLRGHTGTVYSVAFNGDGSLVVSGAVDGSVRLWDIADDNGEPVGGPLTTIGKGRWQVAFLPRVDLVVAGGGDGVLRTWRLDADSVTTRICTATSEPEPDQSGSIEMPELGRGVCVEP